MQCRRTDSSEHRLTLDGYTFYNSNKTTPNWLANPDNDICHAYLNGKVFKIIGGTNPLDSTMALGWTRVDGNDFVTHSGLVYCCIESHVQSFSIATYRKAIHSVDGTILDERFTNIFRYLLASPLHRSKMSTWQRCRNLICSGASSVAPRLTARFFRDHVLMLVRFP